MLVSLSVIAILLVLSAFFSGSETALTAASRPLMHQMAQSGNHRATIVESLHARTERLIGAILLGNNLVNILASALATSLMIAAFGDAGVVYATVAMTFMILIFAEILPKTYAFKNASRVALSVAPVVKVLVFVLGPVTHAIQLVIRGMFKLFGINFDSGAVLEGQAAELRGAIELHAGDNQSVKHERAMLRSVLDLADVQVGEIMIHRKDVDAIGADLTPQSIVDQVLASPYTRIPLWRGEPDNVVAVLHVKALLREVRAKDGRIEELDFVSLAAKPWFIPESTTLLDQLLAFRDRREHFSLVVDEYGSLMGIVTLEDILEEIVGEISDEHDVDVPGVRGHSDGSFTVRGNVTIRDLNREFEWSIPDEEAATVAGLVLHESRRIPEVGQAFKFHNFRFEILTRHRHQITSVRITPPPEIRRRQPQRG
jgi:Mg2+/Co2+ transporter CorB